MSSKILLTRGKLTLVDDADFDNLNQWKWHCTHFGYAARRQGKDIIMMHRQIMNTPRGHDTDHINGDKLDNQRKNLRIASRSQNIVNVGIKVNNTSGCKGVSWSKRANKWQVGIGWNGRRIHLGFFNDIEEAAVAYIRKAEELYGEFARTK